MIRYHLALTLLLLSATAFTEETRPCVNTTSSEPYGFPLTIECPFSVDRGLLDQAVTLVRKASPRTIVSGRFGQLSHPLWNPGLWIGYEPERKDAQIIERCVRVRFSKDTETREPGKASCGRDLVVISAAELLCGDVEEHRREIFALDKVEVIATLCVKGDAPEAATAKARDAVLNLLKALRAGTYLRYGEPGKIETLAGHVHPSAKDIIPAEKREMVFAPLDRDPALKARLEKSEEESTYEQAFEDSGIVEVIDSTLLRQGRVWTEGELTAIKTIDYDPASGSVNLRQPEGRYASRGRTFAPVDGVWIMSSRVWTIRY